MTRSKLVVLALCSLAPLACSKENTVDASTQCGDNSLDCLPCSAGEYRCDGATLKVCQADGQGFDSVSVCVTEALCVKGMPQKACASPVCNAADTKCDGAKMWFCSAGQDELVSATCPSAEACAAGLATGKCGAGDCGMCCMYPGTGCGDGQTCVVSNEETGATTCVQAGTHSANELCSGSGDCAVRLACVQGVCKPTCNQPSDCGDTNIKTCAKVSRNGTPIPGYNVCTSGCDVFSQQGCGVGANCTLLAAQTFADSWTDCIPSGTGKGAGACSAANPNACAKGYACSVTLAPIIDPASCGAGWACPPSNYCTRWCDPANPVCDPGTNCRRIYLIEGWHWGLCDPA